MARAHLVSQGPGTWCGRCGHCLQAVSTHTQMLVLTLRQHCPPLLSTGTAWLCTLGKPGALPGSSVAPHPVSFAFPAHLLAPLPPDDELCDPVMCGSWPSELGTLSHCR